MSLKIKKKMSSDIPPMEGGTYLAVCVGIVDLGEQYNQTFKKFIEKLLIVFEIPSETLEIDGEKKPRWLSKEFTASMGDKGNLKKFLVSWRGKAFTDSELEGAYDITEMLRVPCMLQVLKEEKNEKVYNNISAAIALPAGMGNVEPVSEPFAFDMDEWNEDVFTALPEWIQNKIKNSSQYKTKFAPAQEADIGEDLTPAEDLPTAQAVSDSMEKKEGAPF